MKLKPYPEYKDSGLPWLGKIPKHWATERARWLFQKMDRPFRSDDGVVTCFRDGVVTLRKNRRVRGFTESLKEIGYQGVRKGDLVIHAMDAFAGAVGVSDSDGKCSPVYAVCQPKRDVNPQYYALLVREMSRTQWIAALARGIRERSTDFRFDGFATQVVPIPPKEEQEHITDFLTHVNQRIDRIIRAKRRLIELLNEQKQAIIHRAVIRGLDPNARLKPSGVEWLGEVPEHWEVRRIKQVSKILRGKFSHRPRNDPDMYDGPYPFIQTGDVSRAAKFITAYSQTLNERGLSVSKMFPSGTLVMTIAANIGDVATLTFDACFPDSVIGFVPSKSLGHDYLYYVFLSMKKELLREAPVNTQGNLNIERIGALSMPVPPLDEQERIVLTIEKSTLDLSVTIDRAQREIDLLREYRTRLIADVVTGKLDVRGVIEAGNGPSSSSGPYPDLPDEAEELDDLDPGEDAEAEEIIGTEEKDE